MKEVYKDVFEWLQIIVFALIIALFVNNYILINSYIPTPSMEPTIPAGIRTFGSRLTYKFFKPKRGDIVVFDYGYDCKKCHEMYQKNDDAVCPICHTETKGSKKVYFIKRVIGLPGEHIEIKSDYTAESELFKTTNFSDPNIKATCGHVYIDGERYDENYLNEPMIVNSFFKSVDVIVPKNCYYLLGDNRNNSEDSRFWRNPFMNMKYIIGKPYLIYWPLNKIRLIK